MDQAKEARHEYGAKWRTKVRRRAAKKQSPDNQLLEEWDDHRNQNEVNDYSRRPSVVGNLHLRAVISHVCDERTDEEADGQQDERQGRGIYALGMSSFQQRRDN